MPYECKNCNRTFKTQQGVIAHGDAKRHRVSLWPMFYCRQCDREFSNEHALDQHLRDSPAHKQLARWSTRSLNSITFCSICDKHFSTPDALRMHNASPVHGPRSIPCIGGCPSKFKTPSGLAQHVEGHCNQLSISRHQVTAAVHALNITPAISLPAIEGFVPAPPRSLITYHASQLRLAFNGNGYQCQICNRTFLSLYSLEAHLNSPAHDEDEFKCPKCERQFTLVSGLVQHLESASCGLSGIEDVGMRFAQMTQGLSRSLAF